jgi:hypothetical protein
VTRDPKCVGLLLATSLAIGSFGCAASLDERPLTPAEREMLIRSVTAQKLKRDLDVSRCGSSSKMAQMQARNGRYAGADGFDSRNCPRQGGIVPPR